MDTNREKKAVALAKKSIDTRRVAQGKAAFRKSFWLHLEKLLREHRKEEKRRLLNALVAAIEAEIKRTDKS